MELNRYIDHTNLKPTATMEDIITLCEQAKKYKFYSVCVNPCWVKVAKQNLKGTNVLVTCVVGFPLGANSTEIKIEESKLAKRDGADELDIVINQGLFKMQEYEKVKEEIDAICNATNLVVKVIVETSQLSQSEIIKACGIVNQTKAKFIKTSTGFIGDGARLDDVILMKKHISNGKYIKASGGIRDKETMIKFIEAGAERIGTSSGVKILEMGISKNK